MDILQKHYPEEDHAFIFENATTHQKRADDGLSARKMPKGLSKEGKIWGVTSNVIGPDGRPTYGSNGKLIKHTSAKKGYAILADVDNIVVVGL